MTEPRPTVAPVDVLVMGMHRSGTSAVGQVLARAGLSGGAPGHEAVPKFDNPGGFFERRDMVAFNEELLKTLGWTWDAPPVRALLHSPDRPGFIQRGRKLVAGIRVGPDPWFVKDPRFSLLLPWWRKILADRFVAVVPWRPIEEIAWSLHVRDVLPLALGMALAGAYHRHLAAGLQGLPVIIVDYAMLTEQPEEVVPAILTALGEAGVRGELDVAEGVNAIDPSLRRATQPPSISLESLVSRETSTLMTDWPRGTVQFIRRFGFEPNDAAPWEEAMLDLQRRLRGAQGEQARLRRRVNELEAEATRVIEKPAGQPAITAMTESEKELTDGQDLEGSKPSGPAAG